MKLLNYVLAFDYSKYFIMIGRSLLILLFFKVLKMIVTFITTKWVRRSKTRFMFHQTINVLLNIICVIFLFLLWLPYLKNILTVISFISAGITIAIRDIILNLFAGLYIKTKKPFKLEDRISIDGVTGDVVLINNFSFKILEVGDRINGEQSSGLIINVPNSFVFSHTLKNYNTAFKYIWDEITIKLDINADLEKNKKEIMKIINSNEIVSEIPRKMEKEIRDATVDYRIYYNHLEPIIYTKVNDNHIELNLRFLTHPKKTRIIEDYLWTNILKKYKAKKINLFVD
ncbi:MAG: mechanosensitive ion channel [Bacilli bacterium]|nr:mechanosensitive ion channel [Bacilli bacterium]